MPKTTVSPTTPPASDANKPAVAVTVKLEDLRASLVQVVDENGSRFYLTPAMRSGDYTLRPLTGGA